MRERERERVCECIEPWRLGREIFFFRFEESTNLIEKEKDFFFRDEKEEEERKKERKAKEKEKEDAEEEKS